MGRVLLATGGPASKKLKNIRLETSIKIGGTTAVTRIDNGKFMLHSVCDQEFQNKKNNMVEFTLMRRKMNY